MNINGGVGYEKMIITADLIKRIDSNKVIPLIRQQGTHNLPTFLKSKLFIEFSKPDDFEFSYDELIRTLHKSPLFEKPKIGNNPFEAVENIQPEKSGDALRELISLVVKDFESGEEYSDYLSLVEQIGISRILLDILIEKAEGMKLVTRDSSGDLYLTREGKFYAVEHKLIKP